jgi:phage/plasmid-associated DNA primase
MDQLIPRDDISGGAPRMRRYDPEELEEMLAETSPIVLRKLRPSATQGEINPFLAAAAAMGFKAPIDVEKRLSEMTYMGGGDAAIHGTQVSVTASLLNAGREIEEIVSLVLGATKAAAGDYGTRWNWRREEKAIRGMCDTWIKKHPVEKPDKPAPKLVTATVHKLDDAREKKAEAKPKSQKVIDRENLHVVIGQSVLSVLQAKGEPVMVVGDQLWRYADGLWIELDNHGRHHLDRLIETCTRGVGVTSSLKLVAEVRGWIFRNPDIGRDLMEWDDHGKIAIKGGLIDIKSLAFETAKPSHHVTARINCDYDAKAQCPVWLEMLDSTFADKSEQERVATITLIQDVLGCALIEEKSKALSRALIFHGLSNTGKTDLIKTISGLLTDHPISAPLGALSGTHGLMEFHRKAPWVLHEAFTTGAWHFSDIVKSILSGDPVQINIKNGALLTKRIRQPIFWGTNFPPQFKEATRAIINRMIVIVTSVVFEPKAPVGVALVARTKGYSEPSELILATEKTGLLNWALAGLQRALERGRFETTDEIEATLEDIRTSGNVVVAFLDECVSFSPDYMISTSDFCAALKAHNIEQKEGRPPSNESIGKALIAHGDRRVGVDRKVLRDNKRGYYVGMHLNDVGLEYWLDASGSQDIRGAMSLNQSGVNREVPLTWDDHAVVLRVRKHFKSLGSKPPVFEKVEPIVLEGDEDDLAGVS